MFLQYSVNQYYHIFLNFLFYLCISPTYVAKKNYSYKLRSHAVQTVCYILIHHYHFPSLIIENVKYSQYMIRY